MLLASQDVRHFGKCHLKTQTVWVRERAVYYSQSINNITYQNNFWEARLNWLIWGNLSKIYQNPRRKDVSMVSFGAHSLQKAFEINWINKLNFTKMESVFLKESWTVENKVIDSQNFGAWIFDEPFKNEV